MTSAYTNLHLMLMGFYLCCITLTTCEVRDELREMNSNIRAAARCK